MADPTTLNGAGRIAQLEHARVLLSDMLVLQGATPAPETQRALRAVEAELHQLRGPAGTPCASSVECR